MFHSDGRVFLAGSQIPHRQFVPVFVHRNHHFFVQRNVKRAGRHKIGKLPHQAVGRRIDRVKSAFEIGGQDEPSVRRIQGFRRILHTIQNLLRTSGGRIPDHISGKQETAVGRKSHPGIGNVGLNKRQCVFSRLNFPDARSAGNAAAVG